MSDKKRVYVTGKIAEMTKLEVQDYVESKGYEWSKSISGNLDLLIFGDKAGPKKIQKARQLGIKMISWNEFQAISS